MIKALYYMRANSVWYIQYRSPRLTVLVVDGPQKGAPFASMRRNPKRKQRY